MFKSFTTHTNLSQFQRKGNYYNKLPPQKKKRLKLSLNINNTI